MLIFCGTGVVFFGLVALFEYASWFSTTQRMLLFFSLVAVEVVLLLYYIVWPLVQFIVAGNALSNKKAAQIIGHNLAGVDDRLLNYLEMRELASTSDLIDAGLQQKQQTLGAYRFKEALKLSSLKPFLLFLIPTVLLVSFLIMGNNWFKFKEGTNRLVNYNVEFERHLPFQIEFENDLVVDEGQDYVLSFVVEGDIVPDVLLLESNQGTVQLQRNRGTRFSYTFTNCFKDVPFHVKYDEISSPTFRVEVIKKAVIGRVSVKVMPPRYTKIEPFEIDNRTTIEVPQFSQIEVNYTFKNTDYIEVYGFQADEKIQLADGEKFSARVKADGELTARVEDQQLNRTRFHVIADQRPVINAIVDSVQSGLAIQINAYDDYGIVKANADFLAGGTKQKSLLLPHSETTLKFGLLLKWQDVEKLDELVISVSDHRLKSIQQINLSAFHEKEFSKEDLMNEAGKGIDEIKEAIADANNEKLPGNKNEDLKKKSAEINKKAKELTKKDSANYQRFEQLSEEIMKLVEDMEKEPPVSRKQMKKEQLEEKIKQLEKEWMVLKNIENLKQLEDSLKTNDGAIKEDQMKKLQKEANELKKTLEKDNESDKVDWEKFDELDKKNQDLKNESPNAEDGDKKNGDEQNKDAQESKDELNKNDKPSSQKSQEQKMKKEMQQNSEQLREQLSQMSAMMMMEATQKNIELLRRLELRSLKTSKKQEEVYLDAREQEELGRQVMVAQKEVTNSSKQVLDSLSALNVSNPKLAQVLTAFQNKLDEHLVAMNEEDPANQRAYTSSQRYLQYGLNELAAVLYDILKSEQQNMLNMKAGSKQCNNPKPGKGNKPSMGKKQKELGEKMGKMKKGKGKPKGGKQSYSQKQLLELIKGQEAVIEEYEQNTKGSKAGGDTKLAEDLNNQLDDLIRGDVDKALNRNKDIEDKLITFEESENKKKEQEEKRQSQENKLDYEAIKKDIVQDYLKLNQRDSRIVNLPALKNYFTGKWITINQR